MPDNLKIKEEQFICRKGTLRGLLQKGERVQLTQKFVLCDLGYFFGLGLEGVCVLLLWDWRWSLSEIIGFA